MTEALLINVE